jgi:hypothetical protein
MQGEALYLIAENKSHRILMHRLHPPEGDKPRRGGTAKSSARLQQNLPAAFSFLQSDNQKKEEGYPIARKESDKNTGVCSAPPKGEMQPYAVPPP